MGVHNDDFEVANHYHTATKLVYLPLHQKPLAYKSYPTLSAQVLPSDFASPSMPALDAVSQTVPVASPHEPPLDRSCLATLLFYAAGRVRTRTFSGAGAVTFRAAASAGGLYPIEVYVACSDLADLEAGVYHFSPVDFALRRLRQGDYRQTLAQAAGGDPTVATAPATLMTSAVFWRSAWKYRARSYRYCFWDNGTIVANLLATATATGIPVRVLMGFVDDQVNALIGIDGHLEASLCLVTMGSPSRPSGLAGVTPVPPLAVETGVAAAEPIDYPEMTRLHAASMLPTPEAVVAWRGGLASAPEQRFGVSYALDPQPPTSRSLAEVIRQRGSTRRFARNAMSLAQLSAILRGATTGLPADFLDPHGSSLLHLYLIVHAVEGITPGAYVFSASAQILEGLREGDFRQEAGHLCFEQALGADASVVVFMMADLAAVLQRFGNRGYRAVQLEAGSIGGKMYLGAYALGLGASGLTFFDDEVTAFFAPHAASQSAIFVVALGHTDPENRVRPFRSRLGMVIDALSRRDAPA